VRDEVLKGLIAARVVNPREHRAYRLAGTVTQQAEQVPSKRAPLRDVTETGFERLQPSSQSIHPRRCRPRQHGDERTDITGTVQAQTDRIVPSPSTNQRI
jgi:hypothetical protein